MQRVLAATRCSRCSTPSCCSTQTMTTANASEVELTTPLGRLRGLVTSSGSLVFHGIPYAEPPLAALRWRLPQPISGWNGTLDATTFGHACIQDPAACVSRSDLWVLPSMMPTLPAHLVFAGSRACSAAAGLLFKTSIQLLRTVCSSTSWCRQMRQVRQ